MARFQGSSVEGKRQMADVFRVVYKDSQGNETTREVIPISVDDERMQFTAFCLLRKEERTFRVNRIVEMTKLEQGE